METNQHISGLNKNHNAFLQPENTHSFALNAIQEACDGNGYSIQSEPGNELCVEGLNVKHAIYIGNDEHLLFSDNEIGIFTNKINDELNQCNYNKTLDLDCLDIQYPIQSTFRVRKGCNRTVYWSDCKNPDRYIDLDDLCIHQDNDGNYDCELFSIKQDVNIPCINTSIINGSLEESNYSVQIEYLDEDNNLIYRSYITTPIYLNEGEGLNIDLSDIDTNYPYIRFNLITSSGGIPTAYQTNGTISSTSTSYQITELTELLPIDYSSTLFPVYNIESSRAVEQVQGRLIRANIKEESKDYNCYQNYASKIGTYYKLVDNDVTNMSSNTSFMPNEVYARGIVYIHTDGTESPTFHIPGHCSERVSVDCTPVKLVATGRVIDEFRVLIEVNGEVRSYTSSIGNASDIVVLDEFCAEDVIGTPSVSYQGYTPVEVFIQYENVNINCNYNPTDVIYTDNEEMFAWQLYNTACPITNTKGYMGYWECNNNYLTPENFGKKCEVDCDYWGVDVCGRDIDNTPVRHHLTPPRSLACNKQIQIESYNIEYPPNVVGHYFVYKSMNRVQDSGILGNLRTMNRDNLQEEVFIYHDTFYSDLNTDSDWKYFISPKTLNGQMLDGELYVDYYKDYTNELLEEEYKANPDIFIGINWLDFYNCNSINKTYRIEDEQYLRPSETKFKDSYKLVNLSLNTPLQLFKIDDAEFRLDDTMHSEIYYAQVIQNNNSLCQLENITYERYDDCVLNKDDNNHNVSNRGDNFINNLNYVHTTISNIQDDILDDYLERLLNTVVALGTAAVGVLTGNFGVAIGGIVQYIQTEIQFYSNVIRELRDEIYEDYQNDHNGIFKGSNAIDTFFGGEYYLANEYINNFFVDSYVNYKREDLDIECGNYFKEDNINALLSYLQPRLIEFNEEDNKYQPKPYPCLEFYSYNTDWSRTHYNKYISLPFFYNYCAKCLNHKPYRIVYSSRSFSEELTDSYLTLNANDYVDIPANRGEIVALKYKNNQLLVHTTESTFVLKPYPQQIATDASSLYIKTDDFFSIPATEITQTDLGYGGLQHSDARVNHEHGYIWVDTKQGEIIKFTSNIEEMSRIGLEQWYKEYLPKTTFNHVTYDPRYERTILFTDLFTISFGHKFNSFTSYHSYIQNYSFYNNDYYFTTNNNNLYKHLHVGNYHNYNSIQYPFTIEFIQSNPITQVFQTAHWYATFEEFNKDLIDDDNYSLLTNKCFTPIHKSYDQAIVYNSCQSTGLLDTTHQQQNINPYGETFNKIIITDFNHKLSGLYNITDSKKVYELEFPIITTDKNFINYDLDTYNNPYELSQLRDKYHFIRLTSNSNNRITHFITSSNTLNSYR